jgi:GT2 family glycosyltransferase
MKLGILILQYNSVEFTNRLAKSIPEAIVIDNGSDKGKRFKGANETIRLDKNYGFTIGWNKGIEAVYDRFDAFWLMNNDIEIDRTSIERVQALLERKDIAIFTPSYNGWAKEFDNHFTEDVREVGAIEFCAPIIKKEVFEKIGLLDERFSLGYGVEFDFCYKARKEGYGVHVDDGSSFYHHGQQTTGIELGRTLVEHERIANKERYKVMQEIYGANWQKKTMEGVTLTTELRTPVVIYTTVFGNYDEVKPIPKQKGYKEVEYICVTDNPKLVCPDPWKRLVVVNPCGSLDPRMRAKYHKLLFFRNPVLNKFYKLLYIDASIEVTSDSLLLEAFGDMEHMKLFKHPSNRTTIQEEIKEARKLVKYVGEYMEAQVDHYTEQGYKNEKGLWACGVMARTNNKKVRELMEAWWEENVQWTIQDQLSFPYVCWKQDFNPQAFNGNQGKNDWFKVIWHDDNRVSEARKKLAENKSLYVEQSDKPILNNTKYSPVDMGVLMPVYNTPLVYLKEAVESILNQSDPDFKFVIVDDGSTLPEVIWYLNHLYSKGLITLYRFDKNVKLAKSLNKGLQVCKTEWVIRMDGDDIAHKDLVRVHKNNIRNHPNRICTGVQAERFGRKTKPICHPSLVTAEDAYNMEGFWFVNHIGVCYHRQTVLNLGAYGDTQLAAEDYALWVNILANGHNIYNLPLVLMRHRTTDGKHRNKDVQKFLEKQKSKLDKIKV